MMAFVSPVPASWMLWRGTMIAFVPSSKISFKGEDIYAIDLAPSEDRLGVLGKHIKSKFKETLKNHG